MNSVRNHLPAQVTKIPRSTKLCSYINAGRNGHGLAMKLFLYEHGIESLLLCKFEKF